ncbi:hypothetical protein NC653_027469 [Populus alba x Populus x berolinensis]|uniref:Uncharacterized protein n=1 Tax=Populus alba x Populus x berolinensis TaxID=444605 RepID=A0AAD6M5E7_9ROSI|nr:hypothetical protein NC653_027469 [Populus alba x Populus x berolinensis]
MEGDGGRTYHGMAVGMAERKKENKEDNVYSQPITHKYIQTMTKVTLLDPTNTKASQPANSSQQAAYRHASSSRRNPACRLLTPFIFTFSDWMVSRCEFVLFTYSFSQYKMEKMRVDEQIGKKKKLEN